MRLLVFLLLISVSCSSQNFFWSHTAPPPYVPTGTISYLSKTTFSGKACRTIEISDNGRYLFIVDQDSYLRRYTMTVPWDITTVDLGSVQSLFLFSNTHCTGEVIHSMNISSNQKHIYFMSCDDYIHDLELNYMYDLTTWLNLSSSRFDNWSVDDAYGVYMNPVGTKFSWTVSSNSRTYTYNTSGNFYISSQATYYSTGHHPDRTKGIGKGLEFTPDGMDAMFLYVNTDVSPVKYYLEKFSQTEAFTLTNLYPSVSRTEFDLSAKNSNYVVWDFVMSEDGRYMYVLASGIAGTGYEILMYGL